MSSSFSSERMLEWVRFQASLGARRPGSPADLANEDFILSKLKGFGLSNVHKEPVPVTHWSPGPASLVIAGKSFPVFPIPHAKFAHTAGVEAPLVYADPHCLFARASWRGKIVVADIRFPALETAALMRIALGSHDPAGELKNLEHPATWIRLGWHFYRWAARMGAAGFLGILRDQPGGSCEMFAPYGFREADILDKPIPGGWVRREDAGALVSHAREARKAKLTTTGVSEKSISHNVVGEIPGKTDERVILTTHHDSPFVSPVEDASGVAVMLALAEAFSKREPLQRTLVFLFTSGHFHGSIGTRTFLQKHRNLLPKIALQVSVEHVALEAIEDGEGALHPSGKPEPVGIFIPFNRALKNSVMEGLKANGHDRTLVLPAEGPLGNYPPTDSGDWYEAGVPVVQYISNPVYLLTSDDSLPWVSAERLPKVAALFEDIVVDTDSLPKRVLEAVDFPIRRMLMSLLRFVVSARSTWFGHKPVH